MQRSLRMKKEIQMMSESPPYGISCWPIGDCLDKLEAQILGGEGTPYQHGVFKLEIQIPDRNNILLRCLKNEYMVQTLPYHLYPFEPPKVRFVTPIYHPNIDGAGRICLDTLKMPPKGAWKPCLNISTVLSSIQLLMAEPNPEDPLMTDISNEFKHERLTYERKAKDWTEKHAVPKDMRSPSGSSKEVSGDNNGAIENKPTSKDLSKHEDKKRTLPMDDVTNKCLKLS